MSKITPLSALILSLLLFSCLSPKSSINELYVKNTDELHAAIKNLQENQLSRPSIIYLADGTYRLKKSLKLESMNKLSLKAENPRKVIFTSATQIPYTDFENLDRVIAPPYIKAKAFEKIKIIKLKNSSYKKLFTQGKVNIFSGPYALQRARWPNKGYAHIAKISEQGAIYAAGRTKGAKPKYSKDKPIGGGFTIREELNPHWALELASGHRPNVIAYFCYDWLCWSTGSCIF